MGGAAGDNIEKCKQVCNYCGYGNSASSGYDIVSLDGCKGNATGVSYHISWSLTGKQLADSSQVALNHVEAMECFEGTMVTIMDKMAVSVFYVGIYTGVGLHTAMGDTGKLHAVLDIALPELYAAVIVFAVKARQYFDARCKLTLTNDYLTQR